MFVDGEQFPFLADLRRAWRDIRAECLTLGDESFEPWVQREMYGTGWSVYGLVAFGTRIDAALMNCPRTADALSQIPGLTTAGFSRMDAGTHIKPHQGWVTTVHRAHLGLVVPDGDCALRVGSQTRLWREGDLLVFDDTVVHEAWNYSAHTRTVLLFDFLRPGRTTDQADELPPEVAAAVRRRTRDQK
ncbi:aspartyl/asparaginyl beta-hydroxylase domain-containing protein [Dactylosporangium vinaceum]|uniref:Aspartyl/asparaginyl beta-hydroxylase domain-containing protein n=1 Tax=Dactylosporangium vinaceum TaxID=53362 RepID=A0ABV5MKC3_9ACTN|nr:aspartyl/asparaginyl beta-hydroxylase domain-containing protein [Dactylosporangium vinaceum]UAB99622.1 aspartyl/asparaginyl beta-hydroxylase domain-containing protein [Dactylosporangium vinaceum]